MASKAFGYIDLISKPASVMTVTFKYCVLSPSNSIVTQDANVMVTLSYSNTPHDVWANIVSAVRTNESDSTLIVSPIPYGLDFFTNVKMYPNA